MFIKVERDGEVETVEITGAYIPFNRGGGTIVSCEDYPRVRDITCWEKSNRTTQRRGIEQVYAACYVDHRQTVVHRYLLGVTDPRVQVDHIDGRGLNNRRDNLRLVDNSLNQAGRKKQGRKASSKYKGVDFVKPSGKWRARIMQGKTKHFIGNYLTEKEAALAYNDKARELFGEYARLNVIESEGE